MSTDTGSRRRRVSVRDLKKIVFEPHPGWISTFHAFYDLDPTQDPEITDAPLSNVWAWYSESLLQMNHPGRDLMIDLGWAPGSDPQGSFVLQLIRGRDWENPVLRVVSRNYREIEARIRQILGDNSYYSCK